jgi:hypothetical protein
MTTASPRLAVRCLPRLGDQRLVADVYAADRRALAEKQWRATPIRPGAVSDDLTPEEASTGRASANSKLGISHQVCREAP